MTPLRFKARANVRAEPSLGDRSDILTAEPGLLIQSGYLVY